MGGSMTSRATRGKSGLFLNNRHYDPSTGVFVSVDPLVTMTGEPYIYGSANPITISDPSGLCGCEFFGDLSDYAQPHSDASDQNNVTKNWAGYWSRPQTVGVPTGPKINDIDYPGQVGPNGNAYDAAGSAFNIDPSILMFLDDKETADLIERLMIALGDPFDPIGGPGDVDSFGPLNLNPATALAAVESSATLQDQFPGLLGVAENTWAFERVVLADLEASIWIAAAILDQNRAAYSSSGGGPVGVTPVELALLRYRYGPDTVDGLASQSAMGPNVAAEVTTWRSGWWR